MLVGFFDSGIGGITVLHEALKFMPDVEFLYYADTLNVPYGSKTKVEVKKHVFDAVEFITQKQVKALVIACNTATSAAIDDLRKKYDIPIIGMEPAVKPAVENNGSKRILVTATPLTVKEDKLKNLISKLDNEHLVDLLPLPGLVVFAEKFEFRDEVVTPYLEEVFSKYEMDKYGTVVLGCTHYLFYAPLIRKLLPKNINIIDGNAGTVRNLIKTLDDMNIKVEDVNANTNMKTRADKLTFYNSGIMVNDKEMLDKYNDLLKRLDETG